MKGRNLAARVERLALEGLGFDRISRAVNLPAARVGEILSASVPWREYLARRADRRILASDARRRLLTSDIGRAPVLAHLPDHRGPDGLIVWDSVVGYRSDRESVREAVEAELVERNALLADRRP